MTRNVSPAAQSGMLRGVDDGVTGFFAAFLVVFCCFAINASVYAVYDYHIRDNAINCAIWSYQLIAQSGRINRIEKINFCQQ